MKVSDLPLNALYQRPKITPSVEAAILVKEDFSALVPEYCEKVCRLKCKAPPKNLLSCNNVDVLIIQDHEKQDGKFDRKVGQAERTQQNIIELIAKKAGMQGLTYRITNLLKCPPSPEDFIHGKPPSITTLLKCRPYLYTEIELSKPKVIISLSTAVTKALGLKKYSNTGNRGEIIQSRFGQVVLTLHPRVLIQIRQNSTGTMWGADYFKVIQRDFEKAAGIARGKTKPSLLETVDFYRKNRIKVANTIDDVREYVSEIASLPESRLLSFDTETTGLDPMDLNAKLLCIQFGWRDFHTNEIISRVIPLWHRCNTYLDPEAAWRLVSPVLTGGRGKVGHNGKFDILYIYHTTGIRVKNYMFDTMLLLHSLDSGIQGCYGLKTAIRDHLPYMGLSGYEDLLPALTKRKEEIGDELVEGEENLEVLEEVKND